MLRRTVDALALLAFPVSVFVAGWLYPRSDPVGGATGSDGPYALMIGIVLVGASVSTALAVVRRQLRRRGANGAERQAMGWLVTGWPLPLPRWRSRTGFVPPPENSTSPAGS
jgi:hypothetical protein